MLNTYEEKRLTPRVRVRLPVGMGEHGGVDSVDLSESGLRFHSVVEIDTAMVNVHLHFPGTAIDFSSPAKLIWKKDRFFYGAEFVALSEMQKSALRQGVIETHLNALVEDCHDPCMGKQAMGFFQKDMLRYMSEMVKLCERSAREKEYSGEIEKKLDHLNNEILLKGYCLEEFLSDENISSKIKEHFRELCGVWAYKSDIAKHAFEKPLGYPGDYRMLEMLYDNKKRSKNKNIGVYFDSYLLRSPYAVAVRNRKDRFKEILRDYLYHTHLSTVSILNVACGSCREIRELLPSLVTPSRVIFTCVDTDAQALAFSREALIPAAPSNTLFNFRALDLHKEFSEELTAAAFGKQQLMYNSTGLADYLTDEALRKLIRSLYELLLPGGALIIAHKNKEKNFPPIAPDWFCDWKFIPRDKEQVMKIFYESGIAKFSLTHETDDFGHMLYFTIKKL